MKSVIKTYQSLSEQDKLAFNQLKEEESQRTGRKVTTAELMQAVTPDNQWVEAQAVAA